MNQFESNYAHMLVGILVYALVSAAVLRQTRNLGEIVEEDDAYRLLFALGLSLVVGSMCGITALIKESWDIAMVAIVLFGAGSGFAYRIRKAF